MKWILIILTICALIACSKRDFSELLVINEGFKFGLINSMTDTIISPRYDYVRVVSPDSILVYENFRVATVDLSSLSELGPIVRPDIFVDIAQEPLALLSKGGCKPLRAQDYAKSMKAYRTYPYTLIEYQSNTRGTRVVEFGGKYCYLNKYNDTLACCRIPGGLQYHQAQSDKSIKSTIEYQKPLIPESLDTQSYHTGLLFSKSLLGTVADFTALIETNEFDYYMCIITH